MTFSLAYPWWLFVVSVALAAGLTYWSYRDTVPALDTPQKWLLGGLRFLALALICFLLLEPVARQISEIERPPILAVLVDDSESLRVTAGGGDNASGGGPSGSDDALQRVREQVGGVVQSLLGGSLPGEQRVFTFTDDVNALTGTGSAPPGAAAVADSLTFSGARTDVASALQQVRDELREDNLQGVLLVSDGQYNTGRNPLYVAERYPVPIHTITLGDTTRQRDVQVRRVTTNDIAYVDTELPVQVGLRSDAAGGETVTVRLRAGDRTVDSEDVRLPGGTAEVPVDLTYLPESAGLQRLTVEVSGIDGEATTRNNRQSVSVRVLESKRRVLALAAAPSPNFAAVRRTLATDPNTEVTPRTPNPDGRFLEGPLPDDLQDFDVIVCAGFPSAAVPGSVVDRVASAAESGVPTIFLFDHQTDLPAWQNAFGGSLPVSVERVRSGVTQATFRPAEERSQHPVLQIEGASLDLFRRLPPLRVSNSRFSATPDATVLATPVVRDVSIDDPLLVVRTRAGQRTAALLGTGVWRWANLPRDLESADPLFAGLLNNLVRWAATRQDDRPVRVRPVESTFAGGERVEFTGQVYDESLSPVEDASVEMTITAPDSTQYPYSMEPVGNGRYVLDVGVLPEGTYTYAATASREGSDLGTDRGQFSVGALTLEYKETRANAALMRQIASRSGGGAVASDRVSDVASLVSSSGRFDTQTIQRTQEAELWHVPYFLAAILALLAAEWTFRKRYGLV